MYAQKGRWVTTAGLVLCLCEAVSAAEVELLLTDQHFGDRSMDALRVMQSATQVSYIYSDCRPSRPSEGYAKTLDKVDRF